MMAQARPGKAPWMPARISQRIRGRRNQCSSATDRPATRRQVPSPEPCAGAVRGAAARTDWATSQALAGGPDLLAVLAVVKAAAGADLPGGRRGRPRRPRTGGIASISGMSRVTSLRLPPVSDTASGMPCASVIRCCLAPDPARSAGPGPVLGRPSSPARASRRSPPATSPVRPRRATQPAAIHAAAATLRPDASPAAAASRSSPSQAQLPRQELPRNPRTQDKQHPGQDLPVSSRLRPGWSARRGTTGSTGSIRSHNPSGTIHGGCWPSLTDPPNHHTITAIPTSHSARGP